MATDGQAVKTVGRSEVLEALKLLALIRADGLEAVTQGTSPRKRHLSDRVSAGAYALKAALEEVERWATP